MKNAINYFYNLYVEDIYKVKKHFEFKIKNFSYLLMPCDRTLEEVNELYQISLLLYQKKIPCHQFVVNRNGELITLINNIPYVLFITIYNQKDPISYDNIFYTPYKSVKLDRSDWYDMWQSKIDYIEYQMSQFGKKYKYINQSFNYYIGLAENAISILQYTDKYEQKYIAHKRIKYNTSIINFYNPLNFVVDYKYRNIIEYFKSKFFYSDLKIEEVVLFLEENNLNKNDLVLFFSRFIFPTYYFDLFEDIVISQIDEKVLIKILNKTKQFENFIKLLYKKIRNYIDIPEIEWLKKEVIRH